jgi:hypothetical protein
VFDLIAGHVHRGYHRAWNRNVPQRRLAV